MSTTTPLPPSHSSPIKNITPNTAPSISLTPHQSLLVSSLLDLFSGKPTLAHLTFWSPTATFADPLTSATGYDRFAAQWYGLPAAFERIQLLEHKVVSAGNPIEIELKNRYTAKVVKNTQEIESKVKVWVGGDGKIERVEDRWGGKGLPEGFVGEALRKLNAVTVPLAVKVPKTEEEDRKMREEREKRWAEQEKA